MRDFDVRMAVRAQLSAEHNDDPDTKIVEEMGIWSGSVRIDLAVINGELAGWELKSSKDTLRRLPQQADLYSQVFDRVTIVTASNHLDGCLNLLPEWWGVTEAKQAEDKVQLEPLRAASCNPNLVPLQIARLLWRDECLAVLERHGTVRGLRSKTVAHLQARVAELPMETLRAEVRETLKARPNWLG